MCLYSRQSELKRADSDITCYKIVMANADGRCTPYYRTETVIPQEVLDSSKPYEAEGEAVPYRPYEHGLGLLAWGAGLVHTYRDYRDAAVFMAPSVLIFECTIPEGAMYAEGVTYSGNPSYASERIVFGQLVHASSSMETRRFLRRTGIAQPLW